MNEPLAELAAYFRRQAEVPDRELVRLAAAARAGGSRWEAIAAACGVRAGEDIAGVVSLALHDGSDTGADLLFGATQYSVHKLTGTESYFPRCAGTALAAASRSLTALRPGGPSTSSTAIRRAAPGWRATRPPTMTGAASSFPA